MIYFASPIDFAPELDPGAHDLKAELISRGFPVFDPRSYWNGRTVDIENPLAAIQRENLDMLRTSRYLVAVLPRVQSLGVPVEISFALDYNKPTFILSDISAQESAIMAHWVSRGARLFTNPGDLAKAVYAHHNLRPGVVGKWSGDGVAPRLGKSGDAGFDLTTKIEDTIWIQPGQRVNVPTGIRIELPSDLWYLILGRSSSFARGLVVSPAVIDSGYRGELFACVLNVGSNAVMINNGDRIAQIVPFGNVASNITWNFSETLSDTERGASGFGSTGK